MHIQCKMDYNIMSSNGTRRDVFLSLSSLDFILVVSSHCGQFVVFFYTFLIQNSLVVNGFAVIYSFLEVIMQASRLSLNKFCIPNT